MADLPKAFVVMPFNDEFDRHFEHLIKPALKDAGFHVLRADTVPDHQSIIKTIITSIHMMPHWSWQM